MMKHSVRRTGCRAIFLTGVLLCVFVLPRQSVASERTPNILILYADDLGFGDLGCYNPASKIPTKHLDAFARTAIRFTDGHSSSGICTPSRYALLTGRYHWRDFHGIVGPLGGSVFEAQRLTLPEMLKKRGYQTAAIGKWHLGWDWSSIRHADAKPVSKGRNTVWGPDSFDWSKPVADGPLDHGFDHYFGDTVINFPPYAWIEDNKLVESPDCLMDTKLWPKIKEGNWECRGGPMVSSWNPYENIPTTTAHGVATIEELAKSDDPFFLYFAFPSPHAPIIPNDRFDGTSKAGPYGDFVVETDDAIGQLLRALNRTGEADNTIVIFTADNGPEKYAYARDEKYGHWSSEPLRGLKRDIYEGGHHVPFMIRWPGQANAGRVCEQLVSQIDIMATLAAVVGFELPEDAAEDSHDLSPILNGVDQPVRTAHVHNTRDGQYAIRHENWLLIDAKDGYVSGRNKAWEQRHEYLADDKGEVELYDLADDIGQRHNIASHHPEIVAKLKEKLAVIRTAGYSAPRLVGAK